MEPDRIDLNKSEKKLEKDSYSVWQTNFTTGMPGKGPRAVPENEHFGLRVYLPNTGKRFSEVIIMVSGYAEDTPYVYDRYFGPVLAEQNIPSILLPLPFHMLRRPKNSKRAKELVADDPVRFFAGYLQILRDIAKLANAISKPQGDFAREHFSDDCVVSLLGYSLGGLGVLAAIILDPTRYNACFTFNSGANLFTFNPPDWLLSPGAFQTQRSRLLFFWRQTESWSEFREYLPPAADADSEDSLIFSSLVLGVEPARIHPSIRPLVHKLFLFVGGSDEVCPGLFVKNLEPPGTVLSVLKLPGVQHFYKPAMQAWKKWGKVVGTIVAEFACADLDHPETTS